MTSYKTRLDLPLPTRLQGLPKDKRGYPIPYIVMRDTAGTPHFQVNDAKKVALCIRNDGCPICGQKLMRGRWFIGGPLSALHEKGWFIDPPCHHECAHYALQVCPYIAAPNYDKRLDYATIDYDRLPPGMGIKMDEMAIPDQPPLFVAVHGRKTVLTTQPGGIMYVRPAKPFIAVEYWKAGVQITDPAVYGPVVSQALGRAHVAIENGDDRA